MVIDPVFVSVRLGALYKMVNGFWLSKAQRAILLFQHAMYMVAGL